MQIIDFASWPAEVPLARPYAIAGRRFDHVSMMLVSIEAEGRLGFGAASPVEEITGESPEACREVLSPGRLAWLQGRDLLGLPGLCREAGTRLSGTPAARAAVDMALHDLWARIQDRPLADLLGRVHERLPTSVTIGIMSVEAALAEAGEHLGRGFRILKVKTGDDLDQDLERLAKLRERAGRGVVIRADANEGWPAAGIARALAACEELGVEFVEQPLPAGEEAALRRLPAGARLKLAADESLHDAADAVALAAPPVPFGIFNIKLMKCGGIHEALRIASVAEAAGIDLMWGCMDESVISIAAALHAAFASPATRYLDLDGSFDLARDPARGGFAVEDGCLVTLPRPGLGVEIAP